MGKGWGRAESGGEGGKGVTVEVDEVLILWAHFLFKFLIHYS